MRSESSLVNIKTALNLPNPPHDVIALALILEAIFLRVAMPGDLKPRIVETIGLLLLSWFILTSFVLFYHPA